jgi:hypothetical protein
MSHTASQSISGQPRVLSAAAETHSSCHPSPIPQAEARPEAEDALGRHRTAASSHSTPGMGPAQSSVTAPLFVALGLLFL